MTYKLLGDLLIDETNLPIATNAQKGIIQLTGDIGNNAALPRVTGLQSAPVSSTIPTALGSGTAINHLTLAWDSTNGFWYPTRLTEDDIAKTFNPSITKNGTTLFEVGTPVTNPTFALAVSQTGVANPYAGITAASVVDPDAVPYNVLTSLTGPIPAFQVTGTWTSNTVGNGSPAKTFTFTVTKNGLFKQVFSTLSWNVYACVAQSTNAGFTIADLNPAFKTGTFGRPGSINVASSPIGSERYVYLAYTSTAGTVTKFTDQSGFAFSMNYLGVQASTVNGTPQSFHVYRSVNPLSSAYAVTIS